MARCSSWGCRRRRPARTGRRSRLAEQQQRDPDERRARNQPRCVDAVADDQHGGDRRDQHGERVHEGRAAQLDSRQPSAPASDVHAVEAAHPRRLAQARDERVAQRDEHERGRKMATVARIAPGTAEQEADERRSGEHRARRELPDPTASMSCVVVSQPSRSTKSASKRQQRVAAAVQYRADLEERQEGTPKQGTAAVSVVVAGPASGASTWPAAPAQQAGRIQHEHRPRRSAVARCQSRGNTARIRPARPAPSPAR